jgi:hypothetical protein
MFRKGSVTPDAIDGDAEDRGAIFFELRKGLVVEANLITANRAPVGRIKGEDDGLAFEIAEGQNLVRSCMQREVGSFRAGAK